MELLVFETHGSKIHGFGIFAKRIIVKGDEYYKMPTKLISNIPIAKWVHFNGKWYFDDDVMNWVNHSCDPNSEIVMLNGGLAMLSLRDIEAGEELTCNYNKTEIGGCAVACTCGSDCCNGVFIRID